MMSTVVGCIDIGKIMIKLKKLLTESEYLKREFGESLPTLDSVMKLHQEASESGVDLAKRVLKYQTMEKGTDMQTANLIVTIDKAYDKNPRLQKMFRSMPPKKMISIAQQFRK